MFSQMEEVNIYKQNNTSGGSPLIGETVEPWRHVIWRFGPVLIVLYF